MLVDPALPFVHKRPQPMWFGIVEPDRGNSGFSAHYAEEIMWAAAISGRMATSGGDVALSLPALLRPVRQSDIYAAHFAGHFCWPSTPKYGSRAARVVHFLSAQHTITPC